MKTTHGKVRGKMIELEEDLGFAEGQAVEITVRTISAAAGRQSGEGLIRTEGALANDQEWDEIMEAVYQDRKRDTGRELDQAFRR